jgi:predicted alpha/beta hydrolase
MSEKSLLVHSFGQKNLCLAVAAESHNSKVAFGICANVELIEIKVIKIKVM